MRRHRPGLFTPLGIVALALLALFCAGAFGSVAIFAYEALPCAR